MRQRFVTNRSALMVESVDTRDLKSLGPKGRAGSTPAWGTFSIIQELPNIFKLGVRQFLFSILSPHFPHVHILGSRSRRWYSVGGKECSMSNFRMTNLGQDWLFSYLGITFLGQDWLCSNQRKHSDGRQSVVSNRGIPFLGEDWLFFDCGIPFLGQDWLCSNWRMHSDGRKSVISCRGIPYFGRKWLFFDHGIPFLG